MIDDDRLRELIRRAFDGDEGAQRELADRLLPPIQKSVAAMLRLWRTGSSSGRSVRQEVEDMVQEVWLHLFEGALAAWDPELAGLETYVGLIARRRTAMALRSPRSPWREHPMAAEDQPPRRDSDQPERSAIYRDLWAKIYLCLLAKLEPKYALRFHYRYRLELSATETAKRLGEKANTIQQWCRRELRTMASDCREQAMAGPLESVG